jgi:hypothetical protein
LNSLSSFFERFQKKETTVEKAAEISNDEFEERFSRLPNLAKQLYQGFVTTLRFR